MRDTIPHMLPALCVKKDTARRIENGHLWVYRNEIGILPAHVEPGGLVDVEDSRGKFLGRGYLNARSVITVRLIARQPLDIDAGFFLERIRAADALRRRLFPDETAYRVVFSESDLLPGLIIDRYGSSLVIQTLTAGMDQRKDMICNAVTELFHPQVLVMKNDAPIRDREGLPLEKKVLHGELAGPVLVRKNGIEFDVDILEGQKTGFYLDQSENYQHLKGLVTGARVLDCFCYIGGWALHAARYGAERVEGIDLSEKAIAAALASAKRSALDPVCSFRVANVFDELKKLEGKGERYDCIILDPPSFVKSRAKVQDALRGYKEINLRAMKMLTQGGFLITCSCSYHITRDIFLRMLREASSDTGKGLRLLELLGQARDHPIHLSIPETEYLKCAILQVL